MIFKNQEIQSGCFIHVLVQHLQKEIGKQTRGIEDNHQGMAVNTTGERYL